MALLAGGGGARPAEGGGARPAGRDGVAMGSKMAAAARVVQVRALGRRPGAVGGAAGAGSPARAAGLARSAAARARGGWGLSGRRRGRRRGRCPWRGEGGAARHLMPVPGAGATEGRCRAARSRVCAPAEGSALAGSSFLSHPSSR